MAHREAKIGKFHEYKAFENDPVIGAFKTDDVEAVIAATVAHEVAHHVQYRYGPCTRWLKKSYRKPHGDGFKGGSGIAGILMPIIRGQSKKQTTYASVHSPFDLMIIGHFHQLKMMPELVINGSVKGYDEYAMKMSFPVTI